MAVYYDPNSGYRAETLPTPEVRPVPLISTQEAAQGFTREYEPGTIAHAIQQMFREADQRMAAGYVDMPIEQYAAKAYPKKPEAYREFLQFIEHSQRDSDAVKHVRQELHSGEPKIITSDMDAVGRAWNRNFVRAEKKFKNIISPQDMNKLVFAGRAEFMFAIPDLATQRMVLLGEHPELLEQFGAGQLLKEEEARLGCLLGELKYIDTKDTKQILGYLRRSGTDRTQDQWKSSVKMFRDATFRSDHQTIISSPEYQQAAPGLT